MSDEATRPFQPTVLQRVEDGVGHLTLNRPRAINALDLEMIQWLQAALDAWERDPSVRAVLLDGAGDRGLCAGGDVRGLHGLIAEGRGEDTGIFFRAEYALNAHLADYPKPVVALADGITMGGGIGLAGHASLRIVTERSRLAMPETRIGLTPDVGGSWLLARAPGRIGEFLGVTGGTMDAADAIHAGFADRFVPSDRLDDLAAALRADRLDDFLASVTETAGPSRLAQAQEWIDAAFAADTLPEIVVRLRERPEPAASVVADTIGELSPTSMAVTLAAVRAARELPDLRAALEQEYGLVLWCATTQPDLAEGIRAQLVDKDRSPRWRPATLADLDGDVAAQALGYVPRIPLFAREQGVARD